MWICCSCAESSGLDFFFNFPLSIAGIPTPRRSEEEEVAIGAEKHEHVQVCSYLHSSSQLTVLTHDLSHVNENCGGEGHSASAN